MVVREIAKPIDGEIAVVDFVKVTADTTDAVASYMRQNTVPFYKRKRWFGLF